MQMSSAQMAHLMTLPTHEKILKFFYDNLQSVDTPRGVSAWTGIPVAEARRILEELSKKGVLTAYRTSSTVGYSLSEDKKIHTLLTRRFGGKT